MKQDRYIFPVFLGMTGIFIYVILTINNLLNTYFQLGIFIASSFILSFGYRLIKKSHEKEIADKLKGTIAALGGSIILISAFLNLLFSSVTVFGVSILLTGISLFIVKRRFSIKS